LSGTLLAWLVVAAIPALAEKVPDLGKTKFKDIAKYLSLTPQQQEKIRPDLDRIQEIVKDAAKQRGVGGWNSGGANRTPVGGSGVMARPGPGATGSGGGEATTPEKFEERRAQRKEWQTEITNRVEEIKSFLTPGQLEKFKNVQVPNLMALPSQGGSWR
jgi:hypothetical protein